MSAPLLSLERVHAGYGRVNVLRDVSVTVDAGQVVALIGANGAGKSTLLKTACGLVAPTSGTVTYDGADVTGMRPERLVRRGLALVPEGRLLFGTMSVAENLELGAYSTPAPQRRSALAQRLELVRRLFPVLEERAGQAAATLSGGEQQMLAIARALMSAPRVLLIDEPSLGLAPKVIAQIFSAIDALRESGVALLLAEQDARLALKHAHHGYVMRTGQIALSGPSEELLADDMVRRIYLGTLAAEGSATP